MCIRDRAYEDLSPRPCVRPPAFAARIHAAVSEVVQAEIAHTQAQARQCEARELVRELGILYHTYDMERGKAQPVERVAQSLNAVWTRLRRIAGAAETGSYTHLDVYNRQVVDGWWVVRRRARLERAEQLGAATARLAVGEPQRQVAADLGLARSTLQEWCKPVPVSYTHLDVYKRQLFHAGARGAKVPLAARRRPTRRGRKKVLWIGS